MAKTLYVLATNAVSPNFWGNLQDNGSAPAGANSSYGFNPSKTALTSPFYRGRLGATATNGSALSSSYVDAATGPVKGTGTGSGTAGDSFVAGPFTCTFANAAWTFSWNMRASTAGAVGQIRMRVWKSANADGTSASELTSGAVAGSIITLSTSADANSSISWSPGSITLNNEYLFFQLEWKETTLGTTNNNNVLFRAGTCKIVTPTFAASQSLNISSSSTTALGNGGPNQLSNAPVFTGTLGAGQFPTGWAQTGTDGNCCTLINPGAINGTATDAASIRETASAGFQGLQTSFTWVAGAKYLISAWIRIPTGVTASNVSFNDFGSGNLVDATTLNAQPKDTWVFYSTVYTATGSEPSHFSVVNPASATGTGFDFALPQVQPYVAGSATVINKALTAIASSTTVSLLKLAGKLLSVTASTLASVTATFQSGGGVSHPLTLTVSAASAISNAVLVGAARAIAGATTTTLSKQASKGLALASSATAALARQIGKSLSAVSSSVVSGAEAAVHALLLAIATVTATSLSKQMALPLALGSVTTVSTRSAIAVTRSIASATAVAINASRAFLITLTVAANTAVSNASGVAKAVVVAVTGALVASRATSKALTIQAGAAVNIAKQSFKSAAISIATFATKGVAIAVVRTVQASTLASIGKAIAIALTIAVLSTVTTGRIKQNASRRSEAGALLI